MTKPNHNVANLGVAHHIPRSIEMTNHSPISLDVPLPNPLFVQKLSPPQDYHNLFGEPWINAVNLNPPQNI